MERKCCLSHSSLEVDDGNRSHQLISCGQVISLEIALSRHRSCGRLPYGSHPRLGRVGPRPAVPLSISGGGHAAGPDKVALDIGQPAELVGWAERSPIAACLPHLERSVSFCSPHPTVGIRAELVLRLIQMVGQAHPFPANATIYVCHRHRPSPCGEILMSR